MVQDQGGIKFQSAGILKYLNLARRRRQLKCDPNSACLGRAEQAIADVGPKDIFVMASTKKGFSLVELIASLTLAGILAVALVTIVVTALNGFSLTREASEITQKANLALSRIRIELSNATDITTAETDRIIYTTDDGIYEIQRNNGLITIEKTAGSPTIPAKTLVDDILVEYGSDNFLVYEKSNASAWTTTDAISELHTIRIKLLFSTYTGAVETAINPRMNQVRNAPLFGV